MNAAVLTELNKPLVIEEVGLTDLKFGQVFVSILASGICGAQLQEIRGEKGNAQFIPHLLGHEGCGIVRATGPGVTKVSRGDKVVMHWRKGEGIESDLPTYEFRGRIIRSGRVTTFSEGAIVSENRITKVPQDTSVELCTLLGCGLSTALGTIERDAGLKLGESLLIVGVGGLGVNLIRAASIYGIHPIVAMDVHQGKEAVAMSMGAHDYIDGFNHQPGDYQGFDCIIDTSGSVSAIRNTLPMLQPSGRFIMVGHPKPMETVEMFNADHMFQGEGKTIKATQGGGFQPQIDIPRYVKAYNAGILKLDGIVTNLFHLKDINDGIEMVRKGEASRVLISMTK